MPAGTEVAPCTGLDDGHGTFFAVIPLTSPNPHMKAVLESHGASLRATCAIVLLAAPDASVEAQAADTTARSTTADRLPVVSVIGATVEEAARVPGATAVIGPSVIRERAPLSVMDALRTIPGIQTAGEDPFGLNLNVGLRGMPPRRSSRTLLLEDGMPILLGPYGDPSMHYGPPAEAVEFIEVLKGSGQVTQGPQTSGGVINFVTRSPPVHGSVFEATIGGGSAGYRNLQVFTGLGSRGKGISLDYAYRAGDGVRREQAHTLNNALLKAQLPIGGTRLVLKASLWDEGSDISETGLTQAEFEDDPYSLPFSAAGRFDVRRYAAQLLHDAPNGRLTLRTNAYVARTERTSWRQSGESEERLGEEGYAEDFNCAPGAVSYSECGNQGRPREYVMAGVEPRLSLALGRAHVTTGARIHSEHVRRRQYAGDRPDSRVRDATLTRDNEIETLAVAAFTTVDLQLGSLTVSPGLRLERISQHVRNIFPGSQAGVRQEYTELLPGIGATLQASSGATLFAGVHRGFGPPRPADVYAPAPGQSVVLVDPETSWNWELGTRLEPRPGLNADVTLFRMDFGNLIVEAPASEGRRFVNRGRAEHQGVELSGTARLGTLLEAPDELTVSAAWTWLPVARFHTGGEQDGLHDGNRLPYAARQLANVSVTFDHRSGFSIGTSVSHVGSQYSDDSNSVLPDESGQRGLLPGYTVANVFASRPVRRAGMRLRFSVHNLFDRLYITQRNEGIYTGMRRIVRVEGSFAWGR